MIREFAISIYLIVFKAIFTCCKLFPLKDKTVGVATFGDNIFYTTRALREISDEKIIILIAPSCQFHFDKALTQILPFQITKPFAYIRAIYHLATATTILVDNYLGFLAVTNFKKGTTCIQLWHATGALKRFGLEDPSIKNRPNMAIRRFHKVYQRFHYIAVGSDKMASIFQRSFARPNEIMLRTGVPRTDFFYHPEEKKSALTKLNKWIPSLQKKKVILYAPTFRDDQLKSYKIQLDFKKMHQAFSTEYILLIKLHPAVSYTLDNSYTDFVFDVSDYYQVNHLLLITDILITDYSSIPCEFSFFQKPIIFYAYDLKKYQHLAEDFLETLPGPLVSTTEEIITTIKAEVYNTSKLASFSQIWNKYSKGNSSRTLANFIIESKHRKQDII